jgi:hypothetical protein
MLSRNPERSPRRVDADPAQGADAVEPASRARHELLLQAQQRLPSGNYLPIRARADALRIVIVAVQHDDSALSSLVDELSWLQIDQPVFKPILLLNNSDPSEVRRHGFLYETAIPPRTWPRFAVDGCSYEQYIENRIVEMIRVYNPHHTLVAQPGSPLPAWAFARR